MGRKPPRYDVPNAAPDPLRLVQRFVNTVNCESGEDWLEAWLAEQDIRGVAAGDLARAREVREALRELLYENNRQSEDSDPFPTLAAAADAARLSLDLSRPELVVRADGVDGSVGRVLAVSFLAMLDGS